MINKIDEQMREKFKNVELSEVNVSKDGFTLHLTDIENGHTNVQLTVDNYRNSLIVTASSYDKETKQDKKTQFKKDVGRKMSLKQLQKVHDDFSKMNKVAAIKNYINGLKLSKESLSEGIKEASLDLRMKKAWDNLKEEDAWIVVDMDTGKEKTNPAKKDIAKKAKINFQKKNKGTFKIVNVKTKISESIEKFKQR